MSSRIWNVCVGHDPGLAGLYRSVEDFAQALDAPILSFDAGGRPRLDPSPADGKVHVPCGSGPLAGGCHVIGRTAAAAAARAIGDARLLVVHSLFRGQLSWAAAWAARPGRRYWVVPHGCLDPWGLARRRLAKRAWLGLHRRQFVNADRIVFSTSRGRDKASRWVRGGRAVVVHWPVALPSLSGRDEARGRFRAALGIPPDVPLLLFVGRLHAVKRPLETIRCFCTAETGPAHLLLVCGPGAIDRRRLVDAVPASHVGRIHFVGPYAAGEMGAAYLASDAFISLSGQENFGYAAAEAAAYGLPVILSPGHDLAHDMPRAPAGDLACGWLLPDDTLRAAREAISAWSAATAAGGPHVAARGAAGRAWVGDALSPERFRSAVRGLAAADLS